jgi:hypothetical protein
MEKKIQCAKRKAKGSKKISYANGNQKKEEVITLVLGKVDFESKEVKRYNQGYYINIKRSIQQEKIPVLITECPNI